MSAGERLLRHLARRGLDMLYLNAGSDFAPLVEAYSRDPQGLPVPVLCLEENVAIGMAHGRALATGRAQAVMVHVTVGTAKALCGLMNAAHDRTPIVLLAGRNPVTQAGHRGSRSMYIHWSQEMFDQGGMVREFVKWDYEIRDPAQVEDALDRALEIAMAEPRGPVYLTLPREMLAAESAAPPTTSALSVPTPPAPDPRAVEQLAGLVAGARCPVLLVSDVGLDREDREALAGLASRHALGVVESNRALASNLDPAHPCHLGYDVALALEHADLIVACGAVAPWIPSLQQPGNDVPVVHVGTDTLFTRVPFREFPSVLNLTGCYRLVFGALSAALEGRGAQGTARGRIEALKKAREQARAAKAAKVADTARITKAFASAALNAAKPRDAVVVSEYWVDRDLLDSPLHGSYFYQSPAGGLGWGVPAALGAQEVDRDRMVIAAIGDGAYVFANPAACHHAAAARQLPVLVAVYNNARWGAVESAAQQVYPGLRSSADNALALSGLGPMPDFAAYARASGGYAETVSQPPELGPALARCMDIITRERRHALLNIIGS